ncbi:MAG: 3'(2'), 5'-bisphosphate nucleotidase [Cellvibrionaceae bacterium]|jgi:3'(2'), 5'-bisphosphate nucleotidase
MEVGLLSIDVDVALLNKVAELAQSAGELIMEVYQRDSGFTAYAKPDDSPLTEADLLAHRYLFDQLRVLTPEIPVLSEEGELPEFKVRHQWSCYWLIDPLDGTKEFVSRNGEFTVNIALIAGHKPVLGVVYAPALKTLYKAINNGSSIDGAFYADLNISDTALCDLGEPISVEPIENRIGQRLPIRILTSRHHMKSSVKILCDKIQSKFGFIEISAIGSSLKLCFVASGKADLYPRLGPTSEWDTAAAQAIVEAAGGLVLDGDFKSLRYNLKDSVLNPDFYVFANKPSNENQIFRQWQSVIRGFVKKCS